jgi:hypothetical protein
MISDTFGFILVLLIGSGGQVLDGAMGMGFGVFSASMLLAAAFPRGCFSLESGSL